jgi:hypothetical protein
VEWVSNVGNAEDLARSVGVGALRGGKALRAEDGVCSEVDGVAGAEFNHTVLGQFVGRTVLRAGISGGVAVCG